MLISLANLRKTGSAFQRYSHDSGMASRILILALRISSTCAIPWAFPCISKKNHVSQIVTKY